MKIHRQTLRRLLNDLKSASEQLDVLDKSNTPYSRIIEFQWIRELSLSQLPMYVDELLHLLDLSKRKRPAKK